MPVKKMRVYVAGPIAPHGANQHPGVETYLNVRRAVVWTSRLLHLGFAPFCPHLMNFLWFIGEDPTRITVSLMAGADDNWIEVSHALFVVPDEPGLTRWLESGGTQIEIDRAHDNNIPVFFDLEALLDYRASHFDG